MNIHLKMIFLNETFRHQKRKRGVQVTHKLYGNNKEHLRWKISSTFAPMLQTCTCISIISSILVLNKSGSLTAFNLLPTDFHKRFTACGTEITFVRSPSAIRISHPTNSRCGDLSCDWHVLICSRVVEQQRDNPSQQEGGSIDWG